MIARTTLVAAISAVLIGSVGVAFALYDAGPRMYPGQHWDGAAAGNDAGRDSGARARFYYLATEVIGAAMRDVKGDRAGTITDMYVDRRGRLTGLIVAERGILGFLGDRWILSSDCFTRDTDGAFILKDTTEIPACALRSAENP